MGSIMMGSFMVRSKRLFKGISWLVPLAFWLGAWHIAAWVVECSVEGRGNELLLPYPATVLRTLATMVVTMDFWKTVVASLTRIFFGLVAGVAAGSVLAMVTARWDWMDRLLSPAIRVIRATPVTSFILLVLLWTGRNVVPVIVSALMVLPVVWENLSRGIAAMDKNLLELARAYRFSWWKRVKLVYIPSLKPCFTAALTNAVGLAWKSGVAAEVLCQPKRALGAGIYRAKLYLEIPELFAWTVTVVCLSLMLEALLGRLLSRKKGGRGI